MPPSPAHRPGPAERVASFRRSVSPEVSGLATLLAATPLTVPVIRRVLTRLRPGARISDFTQLLTHGLIHPVRGPRIAYDFAPDVRGELLAAGRTEELRRVVDVVGESLGPSAHRLWQVPELLAGRRLPLPLGLDAETRAWAEPQIAVLHALSGPHAAQARALERMTALPGAHSAGGAAPAPPPSHLRKQEDLVNEPSTPPQPRTDVPPGTPPGPADRRGGGRGTPAVWGNVPPRNPNFTGREELLDALHRRLRKEKATAVLPNAGLQS